MVLIAAVLGAIIFFLLRPAAEVDETPSVADSALFPASEDIAMPVSVGTSADDEVTISPADRAEIQYEIDYSLSQDRPTTIAAADSADAEPVVWWQPKSEEVVYTSSQPVSSGGEVTGANNDEVTDQLFASLADLQAMVDAEIASAPVAAAAIPAVTRANYKYCGSVSTTFGEDFDEDELVEKLAEHQTVQCLAAEFADACSPATMRYGSALFAMTASDGACLFGLVLDEVANLCTIYDTVTDIKKIPDEQVAETFVTNMLSAISPSFNAQSTNSSTPTAGACVPHPIDPA